MAGGLNTLRNGNPNPTTMGPMPHYLASLSPTTTKTSPLSSTTGSPPSSTSSAITTTVTTPIPAGGATNGPGGHLINGGTTPAAGNLSAAASSVSAAPNPMGTAGGTARECAGCRKRITERFLLKALDLFWHEDCLKCGCCDCRLGEVGSTLYNRANLILCKRDYLRLVRFRVFPSF